MLLDIHHKRDYCIIFHSKVSHELESVGLRVSSVFNCYRFRCRYSITTTAKIGAAHIRRRRMLAGWVARFDRNQNWCETTRPQVALYVTVSTPVRPVVPATFTRAAPVAWRTDGRTCRLLAVNSVRGKPLGTRRHFSPTMQRRRPYRRRHRRSFHLSPYLVIFSTTYY